jgi:hypothetical protein
MTMHATDRQIIERLVIPAMMQVVLVGIRNSLGEGAESGPLVGNGFQGVQQVEGRAGQPVESRHSHHVARGKRVEQPPKLGAVGLRPARHFLKHLDCSGGGQGRDLRLHALAVRRDPCIAVNHRPSSL